MACPRNGVNAHPSRRAPGVLRHAELDRQSVSVGRCTRNCNRVFVVTGASRYFGRALAVGFAHLGAEVYVSARTVEAAERTGAEVMLGP
ncbi:hypothetical protein SNARM312S_06050 [Streptomyces narbonensis]